MTERTWLRLYFPRLCHAPASPGTIFPFAKQDLDKSLATVKASYDLAGSTVLGRGRVGDKGRSARTAMKFVSSGTVDSESQLSWQVLGPIFCEQVAVSAKRYQVTKPVGLLVREKRGKGDDMVDIESLAKFVLSGSASLADMLIPGPRTTALSCPIGAAVITSAASPSWRILPSTGMGSQPKGLATFITERKNVTASAICPVSPTDFAAKPAGGLKPCDPSVSGSTTIAAELAAAKLLKPVCREKERFPAVKTDHFNCSNHEISIARLWKDVKIGVSMEVREP